MDNLAEKEIFSESLIKRPLTPEELLEMFVFAVEDGGGSCPSDMHIFLDGLGPASEKLSLLRIFIDPEGEIRLSRAFKNTFEHKSIEGRMEEEWKRIHISDWAKGKIFIRMETIPTPEGQMAFKEAAAAAKKVWSERAI